MNQTETLQKPNILIVPLDWGLGHATRCIPLISALLAQNCNVLLAGEGKVQRLLLSEFPHLKFLPLKGYRTHYSKKKLFLSFSLITQIPKILSTIKEEHNWLQKAAQEYNISAIISDNRYGLYHPKIPSVFITHQLFIKTPFGNKINNYLQKLNYRYINCFSECWVPDTAGKNNFAGELSHPQKMPGIPVKYISPLSRFTNSEAKNSKHILFIISGPEPQRTVFENVLLQQLKDYEGSVVFVRGLPGEAEVIKTSPNICFYNHLRTENLKEKILEASFVISRCGYSTVMDLAALKKKSILIPTPGQTEQEYLARHLMKENFALCIQQNKFCLKNALELAFTFNYKIEKFEWTNNLNQTIKDFAGMLKNKMKKET